ncbi:hypothetical protein [Streptomyces siamensis]|uniref:Uncharacterized protein n=1 Tax=Streptomyces siamensis TaxID=1274986 RepID=A0ABP9JIB9_9ACTN
MTTKAKAKGDDHEAEQEAQAAAAAGEAEQACGKPHHLPALAHITCTEPAPDPDRPPGTPEHEHRYQDGDALYQW